ncbi:DUF4191 family protein [Oerskovia sp. M15]
MTRTQDPAVTWIMLGVFVGIVAVALGIGLWWGQWVYTLIVGLPFAFLGSLFVLTRRAETAAYSRIEGQPGAAERRSARSAAAGRSTRSPSHSPAAGPRFPRHRPRRRRPGG